MTASCDGTTGYNQRLKTKKPEDTNGNDKTSRPFNICFFNAQSLLHKRDELSLRLEEHNLDIVGVAKTWLDGSHSEGDVRIRNYNIEMKN